MYLRVGVGVWVVETRFRTLRRKCSVYIGSITIDRLIVDSNFVISNQVACRITSDYVTAPSHRLSFKRKSITHPRTNKRWSMNPRLFLKHIFIHKTRLLNDTHTYTYPHIRLRISPSDACAQEYSIIDYLKNNILRF